MSNSKLSPVPVVRGHIDTLRDDRTKKFRRVDFALFYGLPMIPAGLAIWKQFHATDVGAFLGGLSVFGALLFGLVVFVFQLRITAASDPRIPPGSRVIRLLDALFKNVNYAVLVGLATTSLGVLSLWLGDSKTGAPVWVSVALVYFVCHLGLTILMCVKRVDAAYRQLTSV